MTYKTYQFTAFSDQALIGGGVVKIGSTFTVPGNASVNISVSDDESVLGGDLRWNEHADDLYVSGATIRNGDGQQVGSGGKIYGEEYLVLRDQSGREYRMVRIEQEGNGADYFSFDNSYGVPSAGTSLTVVRTYNVNKWFGNTSDYSELTAGALPSVDPVGSNGMISGRFFYDADCNDSEWNAETGTWDRGVAYRTVKLTDWADRVLETTTTDRYGNYSFDVKDGYYRIHFPKIDGYEFADRKAGVIEHMDSDAYSAGYTQTITISGGNTVRNIDAGVQKCLGSVSGTIWMDADCDGIQDFEIKSLGEQVYYDGIKKKVNFTTQVNVDKVGTYQLDFEHFTSNFSKYTFQNQISVYVNGVLVGSFAPRKKFNGSYSTTYEIELDEGVNDITFEPRGKTYSYYPSIDEIKITELLVTEAEAGRAGVTVRLYDANDVLVGETVTDADGNYAFERLPVGDYKVKGVAPDGTEFTIQNAGANDNVDSDVDANGEATVHVGGGNTDIDMGLCEIKTGSIAGRYFEDTDRDDLDNGNGGEPGIGGQLVVLLNADGTVVTDANGDPVFTRTDAATGEYRFDGIGTGDYMVAFAPVEGREFVAQGTDLDGNGESDNPAASDVLIFQEGTEVSLNGSKVVVYVTTTFSLGAGEQKADVDAGVVLKNTPPVAVDDCEGPISNRSLYGDDDDDSGNIDQDAAIVITATSNALDNDFDPDGDTIRIVSAGTDTTADPDGWFDWQAASNGGEIRLNTDGTFQFRDLSFAFEELGPDDLALTSLDYAISDGKGATARADLTFKIEAPDCGCPGEPNDGGILRPPHDDWIDFD